MSNVPPLMPDDLPPRPPGPPRPRETIVRPRTPHMGANDGPLLATKITALVHELANLLDGSLRCLTMLQRDVAEGTPHPNDLPASPPCNANRTPEPPSLDTREPRSSIALPAEAPDPDAAAHALSRRLNALHSGLLQMAGLVRAFSGTTSSLNTVFVPDDGYSLADTIRHAAEVFGPVAFEQHARLAVEIPRSFDTLPSRGIFGVLASGIRNAIESIQRSRDAGISDHSGDHSIRIVGSLLPSAALDVPTRHPAATDHPSQSLLIARIDIIDDGIGLPPSISAADPDRPFEYGYTTKPGSIGIGLAMARDTMHSLRGSIRLLPRTQTSGPARRDDSRLPDSRRAGAILRLEWPIALPGADAGNGSSLGGDTPIGAGK